MAEVLLLKTIFHSILLKITSSLVMTSMCMNGMVLPIDTKMTKGDMKMTIEDTERNIEDTKDINNAGTA